MNKTLDKAPSKIRLIRIVSVNLAIPIIDL